MNKIAKFEKVSLKQYIEDMKKNFTFNEEEITHFYNSIILPTRATVGSAGYDFKIPFDIKLNKDETFKIPTGIRVKMDCSWVLMLFPRSSLGFKYRMQLDNTVGIIDSDYYNSDNEGHIVLKITNDSKENKQMIVEKDKGICQGIFLQYGITLDDNANDLRNGGFGSTN